MGRTGAANSPHRLPKQARAKATCAAIFEATAQIVEAEGEARLNTNLIAERAGVSIGTLYQYFPNKQAILIAMAQAEHETWRANAKAARAGGLEADRAAIRTHIQAFPGRPNTRRAAVRAQLDADPRANMDRYPGPDTDDVQVQVEAFVVSRAVLGVIRAAVFEDWPHMHTAEFEDALVRLARTFRSD